MRTAVVATLGAWVIVEVTLLVRDRVRGKGSTASDRGTRSLLIGGWLAAFVAAMAAAMSLSSWHGIRWLQPAGLPAMWAGLAIRVWAVAALGAAFRTTVEVDAGQKLVETGPYRLVRHPSYTGILLIAAGFGLTLDNWLALAVLLVIPVATMLRRIAVEEAVMAEVIGPRYHAYQQRTKRLVPGLW